MSGPSTVRILVANELASYHESIAAVLRSARPDAEVSEADSGEVDREVLRLRPDLMICGRLTRLTGERLPDRAMSPNAATRAAPRSPPRAARASRGGRTAR